MSSSILDAIQGLATPALMQTATAALGLPDKAVNAGLGAAATSLLGGLIQKSGDASVMSAVAGLISSVPADASLLANVGGLLSGGMPVSPANILGNKFLGAVAGSNAASMISGIATTSGVSTKAASGLTALAAPLVLTALRSKLGAAPSAAGLASMLTAERSSIAAAMPASLQSLYGLAGAATVAAAAATPVVAAPVVKVAAQVAAPVAVAPVVKVAAAAAPVAAAPVVAAPVAQAPAVSGQSPVVVKTAAGPVAPSAAAPVVHTASGHASAPAVVQAAAPAAVKATAPVAPVVPHAARVGHAAAHETSSTSWGALLGLFVPLALLTGLIWYWAYGTSGALSVGSAAKVVSAPVIEAAQKKVADLAQQATAPKPAAPAPTPPPAAATPAPAPAPVAAAPVAAPGPLVAMPGANGMVVYELPGGGKIEVAKDGLESKLLAFVGNKDAAVDKKLWFDFDRLSFVTASSDLTPESAAQVASAVAILKAYPNLQVKIGGYTDNQGDPAANLKLSDSRAKSVMERMTKDGIGAGRLEAEGYGEQFPIGDNATPEGRAKNRRTALSVRQK